MTAARAPWQGWTLGRPDAIVAAAGGPDGAAGKAFADMALSFTEFSLRAYLRLVTWRRGHLVGTDAEGNRYYRERRAPAGRREKRWVVFNGGESEATRVPPEWHGWLHHMFDAPPSPDDPPPRPWQKPHVPNLTGTESAYLPAGHALRGGQRPKATGDYEAWTPD